MIIYEREKKTIIIPSGMGDNIGGDCSEEIAAARAEGYSSGVAAGRTAQKAEDDGKITPSITINQNGEYTANYGYKKVNVNVPSGSTPVNLQDKSASVTADTQTIRPDAGYQGMTSVELDATTYGNGKYSEGYQGGYTNGYNEGYAEGSGAQGCQGVYEAGYEEGYQGGYTNGEADQKARLSQATFVENNTYTLENGWNQVTVNVPPTPINLEDKNYGLPSGFQGITLTPDAGYQGLASVRVYDNGYGEERYNAGQGQGYQSGMAAQKAKLSAITITTNTAVTRTDGWSSITVNVPSECNLGPDALSINAGWGGETYLRPSDIGKDGFSEVHIYDNGYGTRKYNNGVEAQKAKLSGATIQANGTYTRVDGWSSVTVNVPQSGGGEHSKFELYIKSGSGNPSTSPYVKDFTINGNTIEQLQPIQAASSKGYKGENWAYKKFGFYCVPVITAITFYDYQKEGSQDITNNAAYYNALRYYVVIDGVELVPTASTKNITGTYNEYCTVTLSFTAAGAIADTIAAAQASVQNVVFSGSVTTTAATELFNIIGPTAAGIDWSYVKVDGVNATSGGDNIAAGTHSIVAYGGEGFYGTTIKPNMSHTWNSIDITIIQ